MNFKMITLKLAVAAMASAMLLSQCIADPEGTDSFRRSIDDRDRYNDKDSSEVPADGTAVYDTIPQP